MLLSRKQMHQRQFSIGRELERSFVELLILKGQENVSRRPQKKFVYSYRGRKKMLSKICDAYFP
jgi:hypothetical protein